jgi:hypothetical protein
MGREASDSGTFVVESLIRWAPWGWLALYSELWRQWQKVLMNAGGGEEGHKKAGNTTGDTYRQEN